MSKIKNASQALSIPKTLMWEQVIESKSALPLADCIERIESIQNGWLATHPIYIYTVRADANHAEFVGEMYMVNKRRGWLMADLHADTSELTSVHIRAGVDPEIVTFFYTGIAASAVIALIGQNLWVWVAALGFLAFLWFELRWSFERVVKRFRAAVGLSR
jgi:hypothetical protein